ncbi:MAG: HXXEE domain-containing protein [Acidobacteriota bacterium]|nr:MAG: HXXEE domain-containing protein [Acidobacteriota bacterium]
MYWLPLIAFAFHMLEEYPRFPEWATRHFGATSNAWYVYSHIPLVTLAIIVCLSAENSSPQTWERIFGTAFAITLALNGIFHIAATILFREYSPGVATGTFFLIPVACYLLIETAGGRLLTGRQTWVAFAIGVVVQIAVVASLYLEMDIDWRLKKQGFDE